MTPEQIIEAFMFRELNTPSDKRLSEEEYNKRKDEYREMTDPAVLLASLTRPGRDMDGSYKEDMVHKHGRPPSPPRRRPF